jgi:hypothetical protein
MHPYECSGCHKWFEGAAYHDIDVKEYIRIIRFGSRADIETLNAGPKFCSEECREAWRKTQ